MMQKQFIHLALAFLILTASEAVAAKGQITYIGTIGLATILDEKHDTVGLSSMGLCTYHHVDYQALDWMAIGLGIGFEKYSVDSATVESKNLDYALVAGRLLNPKWQDAKLMPYLIGGAGLELHASDSNWKGPKHLMAGVGASYAIGNNTGADLQLVGTGLNPTSAELRVGISVGFGGPKEASAASTPVVLSPDKSVETQAASAQTVVQSGVQMVKDDAAATRAEADQAKSAVQAKAQEVAAAAKAQASGTYTVVEGDTLWRIACKTSVYGDCEMYPLLVLANKDLLKSPADLKPGMVLKVNRDVSESMKAKVRASAWREDYVRWRGSKVTKARYDDWKSKRQQMNQP